MLDIDQLCKSIWATAFAGAALLYGVSSGYGYFTRSELEKRGTPPVSAPGDLPIFHHTFTILRTFSIIHDVDAEACAKVNWKPFSYHFLMKRDDVIAATPEIAEDVLSTQFEAFDKGTSVHERLGDVLQNGIFAVDGDLWKHQRKVASRLFTARSLRDSMATTIQKHVVVLKRILQKHVDEQKPIDVARIFGKFTLEAFAEIGFGAELKSLEMEESHPFEHAFDSSQRLTSLRFVFPSLIWKAMRFFRIGSEGELARNVEVIDKTVLGIISQSLEDRRKGFVGNETKTKNLVSLFLDGMDQEKEHGASSADPNFLRDIVVNFMIAGRDTTAQSLAWLFYMLHFHPEVVAKIREEMIVELPELMRGELEAPTKEQCERLVYLEATIRESLRLNPPVPRNLKEANRDVLLSDNTFIKKGTNIFISPYALARNKRVWGEDAKEFRPERFIDENGKLIAYSEFKFNSFHAGPRRCIGMNLALMELKIVAASLLSSFNLKLVPGAKVAYDLSITLPVKGQMMMNVTGSQASYA